MPITATRTPAAVEPASGPIILGLRTDRLWVGGAAGAARLGIMELSYAATPANASTSTVNGQLLTYLTTLGEDGEGEVLRGTTFSLPNVAQEAAALAFADRVADALRRIAALEADYQVRVLGLTTAQGANILTAGDNGTFEANATGWTGGTRVNTISFGGTWSYERSGTSILTATAGLSVVNGTTYRVVAYCRIAAGDDLTVRIGTASADVTSQLIVGEWARVQADITANTTGSVNLEFQVGGPTAFWLDSVTVGALVANGQVTVRIEGRRLGLPMTHAGQGLAAITQPSAGLPRADYEAVVRLDVESATVPGGFDPIVELSVPVTPIAPADPNDPDSLNRAPYEADAVAYLDAVAKAYVEAQQIPLKERNPKILNRAAALIRPLFGDRYLSAEQVVRSRLTAVTPFVVLNTAFDRTKHLLRQERRTSFVNQASCAVITGQGDTLKPYCYPDDFKPQWLTWSTRRAHVRGAPLFASIYAPATGVSLTTLSLRWQGVRESDNVTVSGLLDIGSLALRYPAACDTGLTERVVLFQLDRLLANEIATCTSVEVKLTNKDGSVDYSQALSVEIQGDCGEYVLLKYLNDFGVPEILLAPSPITVAQRTTRLQFSKPAKRLGIEQQDRRSVGIAEVVPVWAYGLSSRATTILEAQRWAEVARSRDVELIVKWEDAIPSTLPAVVEDEEVAYLDTADDTQVVSFTLLVEGQVLSSSDAVSIAQPIGVSSGGGLSQSQVQSLIDASVAPVAADLSALEADMIARVDQWGMPIATNVANFDGVNDQLTWARASAALPDEFTFTCWFKGAFPGGNRILFSTNSSGTGPNQIALVSSWSGSSVGIQAFTISPAGTVIAGLNVGPGDQTQIGPSGLGEWTHIALRVKRTTTTEADIWVNGQAFGRGTTGVAMPTNYGANAALGQAPGASAFMNGFMSHATFHSRRLTRDELLSMSRRGRAFAVPTSGLVAHWPLDASITDDASGNGNTLTAIGGIGLVTMH